jgi:TRAP-type mannitol/chloroaromatic compound transport system substrate-binding protein
MVSEVFQQFGVATVALPGSDIFPALEKGTIDAADFVGPAVNYDLGFHQVTKYILMGPPGTMSVYQPVDLMDLTVNMGAWKRLSPKMQNFVEEQVRTYSLTHYVAIQKANIEAMGKFAAAGTTVARLSQEDVDKFRRAAIPIWYNWARKDADAAKVFKLHLDYMKNGVLGYLTDADLKGQKI